MFDQPDDQSQQNDYSKIFDNTSSGLSSSAPTSPAPGAPSGPITGTAPGDDIATGMSDSSTPDLSELTQPTDSIPGSAPLADSGADSSANDELLGIKQDALQELSPLVGHLDQSPEEKFRTTMMMIQASDDKSLIKNAYDAAKQIQDEKERAQALLDVVNEINYFTQQHN